MAALSAAAPSQRARSQWEADGYLTPLEALDAAGAVARRDRLAALLTPSGGFADARLRNDPHLLYGWIDELVRHPRVLDAVEAVLGPNLLVWRSVFFVKPPGDPGHVAWHQDAAYWELSDDAVVTAWIALTDSTKANGCVRVVPGSHRGALLDHRLGRDCHNRLLRGQVAAADAPADGGTPIELRAGQFSLHHARLLHCSPVNPSAGMRAGLAVRYIPPHVRTTGPRHTALLVRGADESSHYDLAPRLRFDQDPLTLAAHRRSLRRYALVAVLQILRRPRPQHLALLARMAVRRDVLRAMLPRFRAPRRPARASAATDAEVRRHG